MIRNSYTINILDSYTVKPETKQTGKLKYAEKINRTIIYGEKSIY